jgi:hypothetical protein
MSSYALTSKHKSYPSARVKNPHGSDIEVHVLGQLGVGGGSHLIASMNVRQAEHPDYIDALDEPSARIGNVDLAHQDPSSLYTFSVSRNGHPWHRHAGTRSFTAISGSAGTELRFSTATDAELALDPRLFLRRMHCISVPPDCLFTVRFGREVWHQFLSENGRHQHPALFAVSCHPNELDGNLSAQQRQAIDDNAASIPGLTEVLPVSVMALLEHMDLHAAGVTHTRLMMHTPFQSTLIQCSRLRSWFGALRTAFVKRVSYHAYHYHSSQLQVVRGAGKTSPLLEAALPASARTHTDCVYADLSADQLAQRSPAAMLALLLQAFVDQPPQSVSKLMNLRNVLVKPLGLRQAKLGCPVSSLAGACLQKDDSNAWFAQRFPVHAQQISEHAAEVILGADDKHLRFRTAVGVQRNLDGSARVFLSTRVETLNAFGRFYMFAIRHTHERYIAPLLLRTALETVLQCVAATKPNALKIVS